MPCLFRQCIPFPYFWLHHWPSQGHEQNITQKGIFTNATQWTIEKSSSKQLSLICFNSNCTHILGTIRQATPKQCQKFERADWILANVFQIHKRTISIHSACISLYFFSKHPANLVPSISKTGLHVGKQCCIYSQATLRACESCRIIVLFSNRGLQPQAVR